MQRKSGGQLVFDARHIPKRFRMVFMQGVASAVNFILHRNSILRIVDASWSDSVVARHLTSNNKFGDL